MSSSNDTAAAFPSNYPLGRNTLASVRLNLQHLLWTTGNPSLLHHSIPLPSEPRTPSEAEPFLIADVGTGTGIWSTSLSLSGMLPSQARIEGFDIDLAQTPPKAWTPANVSWRTLDILKEPSTADGSLSLVGRFDVVHVRLLMLIVQNGDPMPLLRRLMALVKPGGYLHWQEYDLLSQKLVVAGKQDLTPEEAMHASPMLERMRKAISQSVDVYRTHAWVQKVHERLDEVGGELVAHERAWTHPSALPVKQETTFLVMREWCAGVRSHGEKGREEADELEQLCDDAEEECWRSRRSTVIDTQMVTWVVKKKAAAL
ncbi:unnamed protein product [Cercospora beticola]|nr:unnamed protein product [Cercospora beticola]